MLLFKISSKPNVLAKKNIFDSQWRKLDQVFFSIFIEIFPFKIKMCVKNNLQWNKYHNSVNVSEKNRKDGRFKRALTFRTWYYWLKKSDNLFWPSCLDSSNRYKVRHYNGVNKILNKCILFPSLCDPQQPLTV